MFTSICKVEFQKSFFQEYEFDLNRMELGTEGIKEQTYGFKISSLSLLFKNLAFKNTVSTNNTARASSNGLDFDEKGSGASSEHNSKQGLNDLILTLDNTYDCEDEHVNKLIVIMKTKNNITKEYLPNIIPFPFEYVTLERKYKQEFLKTYGNNENVDTRLKNLFLSIEENFTASDPEFFDLIEDEYMEQEEQADVLQVNYVKGLLLIWKKFMDGLNTSNIEEIKIDIDRSVLKCEAFTKSIVNQKSNEILKNGMFTMTSIQIRDLENTCLYTGKESVTVRLRDFKMFINLSNSWINSKFGPSLSKNSEDFNDDISAESQCLNMWFANNGFPMLLEMHYTDLVKFNLFLVTDYKQDQVAENGVLVKSELDARVKHAVPIVTSKASIEVVKPPCNKLFVQDNEEEEEDFGNDHGVDFFQEPMGHEENNQYNDSPNAKEAPPADNIKEVQTQTEPSAVQSTIAKDDKRSKRSLSEDDEETNDSFYSKKQKALRRRGQEDEEEEDEDVFKPTWKKPLTTHISGRRLLNKKNGLSNENPAFLESGRDADDSDLYLHTRHSIPLGKSDHSSTNLSNTESSSIGYRDEAVHKKMLDPSLTESIVLAKAPTEGNGNRQGTFNSNSSDTRLRYGSPENGAKSEITGKELTKEQEEDSTNSKENDNTFSNSDDTNDAFELGPTQNKPRLHGLFD
ncbi:hypothetical protein ACO0QE_003549 [Hanseniaspora vineae]